VSVDTTTEELIEVLSETGEITGIVKPKSAVHRDGDWHRAVHVWIVTPAERLILQLRSREKITYPGLWDVSCAGHVSAGESAVESAVREFEEELGLSVTAEELEFVGTVVDRTSFRNGTHHENEFQETYLLRREVRVEQLTLQGSEVDDVMLLPLDSFAQRVESRDPALAPHWKGYELLLQHLGR
jgi:isopentenyldiphosphate isomerase